MDGHRNEDKAAGAEGVFLGKLRISYSDTTAEVSEFVVESARSALHKFAKGTLKHFAEVAKVSGVTIAPHRCVRWGATAACARESRRTVAVEACGCGRWPAKQTSMPFAVVALASLRVGCRRGSEIALVAVCV